MSIIESKISELGFTLPSTPKPLASYIPSNFSDNLIFTSGQLPMKDGAIISIGKVGTDLTLEEAGKATEIAILNAISSLKLHTPTLDNISKIVKLGVYVASSPNFIEQHKVANFGSELILKIFGDIGYHARFAIGVSSLPLNASVEVELIVEIKS